MAKTILIVLLIAAGIIGFLGWQQSREQPFTVSGFIEADEVRIGSRVGGRVARVLGVEGRTVKAGEPLIELDPFDWREQLAEAQAQLAANQAEYERIKSGYRAEEIEQARAKRDAAQAALDLAVAGPRPREIEVAREELNRAKADLAFSTSEHARIAKLRESAQSSPMEYEEVVRRLKTAEATAAAAEQKLALLTEGTRAEEIASARAKAAEASQALKLLEAGYQPEVVAEAAARVDAAKARVAAMDVRIKELTILSPCDCSIESIDLRPGDQIAAGAPAVSLLELNKLWVRAYVPEARLGEVKLDQRVVVRVDSSPKDPLVGRISFIAREAEFTPRNVQTPEERSKQAFRIKVTLETGVEKARIGTAADVCFDEAVK